MKGFALALVLTLGACYSSSEPTPKHDPVALRIFNGVRNGTMAMNQSIQIPVAALDAAGREVTMPAGLSLVSRDTTRVLIEGGDHVRGRGPTPGVWIVATVPYDGRILADSMVWVVACASGIVPVYSPSSLTLAVGESATETLDIVGCGGFDHNTGPFTWTSQNPAIASVNASTGRVTGVSPGTTTVSANGIGGVTVTVR